jgi:hypothetical protein
MIVFILGLPGSGKSSAARYIKTYVPEHFSGWSTERKSDYTILKRMCYEEKDVRLHPTENDGFDVLEHSAFNSALKRLNSEVLEEYEGSGSANKLTTIEFSRNDYTFALEEFFLDFLVKFHKSTYILFIETDIPVCKERIQKRISKPLGDRSVDDHPVSEFIFETYYKRDKQHYCDSVVKRLRERFRIPDSHTQVIQNGELAEKDFQEIVGMFTEGILSEEITARSTTLPQSQEEEFEQHIAENESGTEIQTSSTKMLAEAIRA